MQMSGQRCVRLNVSKHETQKEGMTIPSGCRCRSLRPASNLQGEGSMISSPNEYAEGGHMTIVTLCVQQTNTITHVQEVAELT